MGALTSQVVGGSVREAAPCCPRCGYDQSGLVATWDDRCSLRGLCSECGFEFDWARVINAEKYRLGWFYEHARGVRPEFRRAWRTWQRAVLPWRFWRAEGGVRLDSPRNGWRLLAWLPLLVACVWVIGCTVGLCQTIALSYTHPFWIQNRQASTASGRGWSWWLETIMQGYLAPLGWVGRSGKGWSFTFSFLEYTPYPVKAWLACCLVMPLMLLILPRTRAMVKVSPFHVWRAAVYGMALLVVWPLELFVDNVIGLMPELNDWRWRVGAANQPIFLALQAMWALLGVGWFGLWWWIVLVRVFALPNGKWVWGLLMIACVLAACVVAAFSTDFAMLLFG